MTSLYKYGAIGFVVLLLIGVAFMYGHHVDDLAWQVKATKSTAAAQAQLARQESNNATLSADQATSNAQIAALQQTIASQLPTIEKVYHHVPSKSTHATGYTATVVSGPLYLTAGLVRLYDASLDLPSPTPSGQPDDSTAAISSAVTVSDYIGTSLKNNGICTANTTQLMLLQQWVRGLKY